MTVQRRQHRRVCLSYPGHIMSVDHVLIAKCRVEDVSRTGMKISLDYAEDAPDEFILLLTGPRGGVTRLCKVVRRDQGSVGVVYDNTIVPEVVQRSSRKTRAERRLANGLAVEELPDRPSIGPLEEGDGISIVTHAYVSLSLPDVRLLRQIAHFGTNFGKLPLKYKFEPEAVVTLVDRGLVERGPSGWPGVPAYRITAAGKLALHDWMPSQK